MAATVATATNVAWGIMKTKPVLQPQAVGDNPWSENNIGCSSCHYGANVTGALAQSGVDVNDTADTAPFGDMANADICGACHSRYSYTVDQFAVRTIENVKLDGTGAIIPNPSPTAAIQPQWRSATRCSVRRLRRLPRAGSRPLHWLSTSRTRSRAGRLIPRRLPPVLAFCRPTGKSPGKDTLYQQTGHDGSATQYPMGPARVMRRALTALTSMPFWASMPEATKQECLECHSADFRIMKETGKAVTSADVKYGITCVGCHAPHDAGTISGVWDEEFDAQLRNDKNLGGNGSNLCTECHNGESPNRLHRFAGRRSPSPDEKEMMDGYGAIDVQSFPSVHKGKCIQCHMAPTSYSRGSVQLGGNHTFTIIEPEVAMRRPRRCRSRRLSFLRRGSRAPG